MDKKQYIIRQIAKTNKKSYENYVVTGIMHGIRDLNVKVVTQQYVKRSEQGGKVKWGLADLFIPETNTVIEVDEAYHIKTIDADQAKDADYVSALGCTPIRVITGLGVSLDSIDQQIDGVVASIRDQVARNRVNPEFVAWGPEKEFEPQTWIDRGKIDVKERVAFRTAAEACQCMGLNYKGFQRGMAPHPIFKDTGIWFPKLYPHGIWENDYDESTHIITERRIDSVERQREHVARWCDDARSDNAVCPGGEEHLCSLTQWAVLSLDGGRG